MAKYKVIYKITETKSSVIISVENFVYDVIIAVNLELYIVSGAIFSIMNF